MLILPLLLQLLQLGQLGLLLAHSSSHAGHNCSLYVRVFIL